MVNFTCLGEATNRPRESSTCFIPSHGHTPGTFSLGNNGILDFIVKIHRRLVQGPVLEFQLSLNGQVLKVLKLSYSVS